MSGDAQTSPVALLSLRASFSQSLPSNSHRGALGPILGDELGRFSGRGDGDDRRGPDVVGSVDSAHRTEVELRNIH